MPNRDGYWMFSGGPLRHKYLHREVAKKMLRRELEKGEVIHHRNTNRLNSRPQCARPSGEGIGAENNQPSSVIQTGREIRSTTTT